MLTEALVARTLFCRVSRKTKAAATAAHMPARASDAASTRPARPAVNELGDRSLGWPPDLRRRWTYAAAVGAVGGYVL